MHRSFSTFLILLILYKYWNAPQVVFVTRSPIDRLESNCTTRFRMGNCGAMTERPILMISIVTLASYCLVPIKRSSILASFISNLSWDILCLMSFMQRSIEAAASAWPECALGLTRRITESQRHDNEQLGGAFQRHQKVSNITSPHCSNNWLWQQ